MPSLASPAQSSHLVVLTEKLNTRPESAKLVSHTQIKWWQPDLRKRRQLELGDRLLPGSGVEGE